MAGRTGSSSWARVGVGLAAGALVGLIGVDLGLVALVSFWDDPTFIVPATGIVFALGWLTPLRRPLAVVTAFAAVAWLAVAYTPLVAWLADGLVRRDPPAATDAVFVFASSLQEDGEPTAQAAARLLRGVEMLAEGRADRLVVSEIPRSRPHVTLARDWTRRFVSRPVEVVTVGPIRNTHEEALAVAGLCARRGWRRLLAVTAPVHTRRACGALERAGLQVVCVPAVETSYDLEHLREPEDRRIGLAPVLHERIGLWLYRRRGWIR